MVINRLGFVLFLFHTWTALVSWIGARDNRCPSTLRKLVSQATVYKLWLVRNNMLHNNTASMPQLTFKFIDRLIPDSILARQKKGCSKIDAILAYV